MQSAIIIGGGIVGLTTGIALAETGWDVTVLEQDTARSAPSWGNAGHLATEQVVPLASAESLRTFVRRLFVFGGALAMPPRELPTWLPFALRFLNAARPGRFASGSRALAGLMAGALPAWQQLGEALDEPDLVHAGGHFVTWQGAHEAHQGQKAWSAQDTGTAHVEVVTDSQLANLRRLSPGIAGAIRFDGSGHVADLDVLRAALERRLAALGGKLCMSTAQVSRQGRQVAVNGEVADLVVVAAGVGSGALMKALGHRAPIIAERGYHVRVDVGNWPQDTPPVVFEDHSMIVTRYRTCVQAASFVEFSRADAPPDSRKWERLERQIRKLDLPITGPFRRWFGCRPTLPDYLPAIGRSTRIDNLVYAFGHQHLGLTLAATTAQHVAALANRRDPGMDLSPFDIERFA